jgi:hypothetical protein
MTFLTECPCVAIPTSTSSPASTPTSSGGGKVNRGLQRPKMAESIHDRHERCERESERARSTSERAGSTEERGSRYRWIREGAMAAKTDLPQNIVSRHRVQQVKTAKHVGSLHIESLYEKTHHFPPLASLILPETHYSRLTASGWSDRFAHGACLLRILS